MQRIIGESSTLAETLEHVSRVAPLNRPVLVIGERGSGKEMIAERLHFLSQRWGDTFHKINCAAISESLLDSELFGHEAGAFTGATKKRLGIFERVDGGTLFLDELATLPLRIQEKLLRIIEYGEFERLGGQHTIQVDVRIVAATHANLPELAKDGKFRHDLLDRLAFDVVHVPPLRQRKDDIPVLVDHFATRMCQELSRDYYSGFSPHALEQLQNYPWPGNIRELKNVVERSLCHWSDFDEPIDDVIFNPFKSPFLQQLDLEIQASEILDNPTEEENSPDASQNFHEKVKQFEVSLIQNALETHQHHQGHTAKSMGLSYHQLRALLRKYQQELT